jgi:hypothetical protein
MSPRAMMLNKAECAVYARFADHALPESTGPARARESEGGIVA